jgi:ABC-type iron transport system FetAB ATPase subunit
LEREKLKKMPAPPDINGCSLTYSDIKYKIGEKEILLGISGEVRAGEFLAIMGPSGTAYCSSI